MNLFGKWVIFEEALKEKESLVELAYDYNVPIFCPAFTDSSAGFGLVLHQVKIRKIT